MNAQIKYEDWATSWTRDILYTAAATESTIVGRVTSLTEYPDIAWPSGSMPHSRHKAGNDIDIGVSELLPAGTGTQAIDFTLPFNLNQPAITAQEREVVNRILAVVQAAGADRVANIFIGGTSSDPSYPRIHAILNALGAPSHSPSAGHSNHIHITLKPPAFPRPRTAGAPKTSTRASGTSRKRLRIWSRMI